MNRIEAMVPPPIEKEIQLYQELHGFENRSQTIRALLMKGLSTHRPWSPEYDVPFSMENNHAQSINNE